MKIPRHPEAVHSDKIDAFCMLMKCLDWDTIYDMAEHDKIPTDEVLKNLLPIVWDATDTYKHEMIQHLKNRLIKK